MAPSVIHYYIWYRVEGDAVAVRLAIDAMQHDVATRTGIRGRVLVRRDDPHTWMEIYEDVAAAASFEHELAAAVERHRIADFAHDRARHTEAFVAAH
ncbi:MAG: DUF4936 family protein [Betaproteobacteria bacterium]